MREHKYKIWNGKEMEIFTLDNEFDCITGWLDDSILLEFTGLKDKNGKEIYCGDILRYRRPYRSTQTHTGDNIPTGSYTEPMEPEIETNIEEVIFKDGIYGVNNDEMPQLDPVIPISWINQFYEEKDIKDAISYGGVDVFDWNEGTDGDLGYLLEKYNLQNLSALCGYVSGIEIIGNIHQHSELLTKA